VQLKVTYEAQTRYTKLHKEHTKSKPKSKESKENLNRQATLKQLMCVCISLCKTVVHNTAQNSSANLPSYHPDNHRCSDVV